ncbi:MAG: methionyl-tRNA formyltransferase [Acidobacteria bacterium RIFCSPLOWO2_12_FULL_65_11]|nr:MAG: methionyl-tRNA formyltransferase [Acidobacteria bacterium RIFCSPLOWO2_02_FULL_64_15]OFW33180.1 MAG: methionyl-tRNA formyltransferase [Acidobacteria bacterium RIFCSPLOWO2_12_FULL_65_11]
MVDAGGLRIVFFGTPQFAVPTLDLLLKSRHCVVGVVSQPDRPRGRGQRTTDAPVKVTALSAGLPIVQPQQLKDPALLDRLRELDADLAVVAAYGRLIPETLLALPRLGMINVHASLLPRYRGAAPVHRAVMAGERLTGVTIMRLVKEMDAGPILAVADRPIDPNETSEEVERDLARLGAELLVSTVDTMAIGRAEESPQDDRLATLAPRLTKEDGLIAWSWPAERIHNQIRGLHPWPHAFTFLRDHRLILLRSTWSPTGSGASPGTILAAAGDHLDVAAGEGIVRVTEIQPEARRPMSARDFLAGHHLVGGDRFGAP